MRWLGNKSMRRLRGLIEAIRAGEYNVHFDTAKLRGDERLLVEELNSVVTDMRAQIDRQEALYGSYEAMLNHVNASLLAVDADDRIVWMNKKAIEDLCGYAIDSVTMLNAIDESLPDTMAMMQPGQQQLLSLNIAGHQEQVKITMVRYIQDGKSIRLFAIENVQQMVQQSETEAQRKLVSVLTHEIMNSLTPIISLSETLSENMRNGCDDKDDDCCMAIDAINRRSRGLLAFVENYRKLSRISAPQLSWVKIGDLIEGVSTLLSNQTLRYEIEDADLQLNIDRHQIEQVLINLLKNSIEACEELEDASIAVVARADHANRHYVIRVTDNGPGIAPEAIDNIFTPFFTTKTQGSGIGLSLSRQIILNHSGMINVVSVPGCTTFTILLPLVYRI